MTTPSVGTVSRSDCSNRFPSERCAACYARSNSGNYPCATVLDLGAYTFWTAGHQIYLRPKEQHLLTLLMRSPNSVLRIEDLIAALYGNIGLDAGRMRLRRLVADIRSRLGADFARRLRTIHKVGLIFLDKLE